MRRVKRRILIWSTREPLPPAFAEAWSRRMARSPHGNFSMSLPYLESESKQGRHARAVLADDGVRGGAIVLREHAGGWHSGWPWRWQSTIEDPARDGRVGVAAEETRWLFECACEAASGGRLRFFTPEGPVDGVPGFLAGGTLVQSLAHDDDAMLMAMDATKRRTVRRARESGCEVVEATSPELWKAFAEVQVDTKRRHGVAVEGVAQDPAPGEQWREWELPWMWLLVAVREGRVVSGFGLGLCPGGMLEGRTSATSEEGRKLGAFPLLVHEASIRARDRGYRWHNNGGDTFFKRDVLGRFAERVDIHCWLGGGALWAIPNHGEVWGRETARRARRLQKRLLETRRLKSR